MNGVIQSVQERPVTLTNNTAPITFTNDDVRSRSAGCCGWLCHQEGSPLYQILDGGYYAVRFNANVSGATAGTPVALALYEDGIIVPGTTVIATITAAGDVENVSFDKIIKVCCRANATLTVASVPSVPDFTDLTAPGVDTQAPIISSANLIIERLS